MIDNPSSPSGRHANGRFAVGHKGGRRRGSRNEVSHKALIAIFDDFEAHKAELLNRLRVTYAPDYSRTLARLVARLRQVLAATENPRRAGVLEGDLAAADAAR